MCTFAQQSHTNDPTMTNEPMSTQITFTSQDPPLVKSMDLSVQTRWLSWGSKGVLTLIDQGLIGGSNFAIGILLARQLSPAQYGAYALAFEIFLVLSLAYACLIMEPMLVFGPSTYRDHFQKYFGVLLWMHFAVALATAVLLGSSALLVQKLGGPASLPRALEGAMLAGPCVLLFWLVRRAFYVKLDPKAAVVGGFVYGSVLLTGALIFYELRLLSAFITFMVMAAGALTATPLLLRRLKPLMVLRPICPSMREVIHQHWSYGRWALAASVAAWVSGNIYYVLLSSMRGLAETGAFKALQNFAAPAGQVFSALAVLVLPYAARAYQKSGAAGVERISWRLTPLYAGGTVMYWVAFVMFEYPIVHFLYGGRYLELNYLVPWLALGSVFRIATVVQTISLKALRSTYLAFVGFALSDVVACLIGAPAIWAFGLRGAVCAYVLSGAAGLIAGFILLRRMARRAAGPIGCPSPKPSPLPDSQAQVVTTT
jgi:O-antigen/teichoic acid export membrane protein